MSAVPLRASPMTPHVYDVIRSRRETKDTVSIELEPRQDAIGKHEAGQFNMLYVYGRGEVPISISGGSDRRLTHTIRAVGSVTDAIVGLKKGSQIGVRGPYGTAWPLLPAEGSDLLIIAGGIGLAPLRPVMLQAMANRQKYGRIILLYGARSPDDLLFRKDLEKWRARFDIEVEVTVDRAAGGWSGGVGVVTRLIERAMFNPDETVAMVCGPQVMMHYAVAELLRMTVPAESIYVSMERNMQCGIAQCGHCQFGPHLVCRDGPVFRYDQVRRWLRHWEI